MRPEIFLLIAVPSLPLLFLGIEYLLDGIKNLLDNIRFKIRLRKSIKQAKIDEKHRIEREKFNFNPTDPFL